MGTGRTVVFYVLPCIFMLKLSLLRSAADEDRKVHIIYMGSIPEGEYSASSHHSSLLEKVVEGRSVENLLVRSYKRSFNGFAAKLTDHEAQKLAGMEGVVSVFPSRTLQLQTTRSWDFMGFYENSSRNASSEGDIIIGIIDSGVWPESESFNDEDFGPPPVKWKSVCNGGQNFTCNNKIIGARYYITSNGTESARDDVGHGTHTASTAAGNAVKNVSFYGLAEGTARGGVPSARIAVYKVCNVQGCVGDAILSAFDDAIADGVDIITVSIGFSSATNFIEDEIAIGAFHSMAKGVLTVQAGGNHGPQEGSVSSVAPWSLTVAASSIDRQFIDKVFLGNGKMLIGSSVNSFVINGTKYPLIYGAQASTPCADQSLAYCNADGTCLRSGVVKRKIVLCDVYAGVFDAQIAGALGSISPNLPNRADSVVPLPALTLNSDDYNLVLSYAVNSTKNPTATIAKTQEVADSAAPVVASFSSRGPNTIAYEIMKPDISAPGIDILGAFAPTISPSRSIIDPRRVQYSISSGTSIACPHAAGVAAFVKAFHPDWSPTAIKSAIMTTAWTMNPTKNSDAEFAYGSGHINPVKAINPGLLYDATRDDYINLLCSLGYDELTIKVISGDNIGCPQGANKTSAKDFNYPALTVQVQQNKSFTVEFNRTITNVGIANSTYNANVVPNSSLDIEVIPDVLSFKTLNEKKSFVVTVSGGGWSGAKVQSASLVWSDGTHSARSPIVVHTLNI